MDKMQCIECMWHYMHSTTYVPNILHKHNLYNLFLHLLHQPDGKLYWEYKYVTRKSVFTTGHMKKLQELLHKSMPSAKWNRNNIQSTTRNPTRMSACNRAEMKPKKVNNCIYNFYSIKTTIKIKYSKRITLKADLKISTPSVVCECVHLCLCVLSCGFNNFTAMHGD